MKLGKQIITLISFCLLTALPFSLLLHFSNNAYSKFVNITQLNYNLQSVDNPITVRDFDSISERISTDCVSFTYEADEVSIKDATVTPIYTTHSFFELYNIQLNGECFSQDDVIKSAKKAIISDTLALKLFFTTDVVNKTIEIYDEPFTVCAVYTVSDNLIDENSKDGKERVFIPYTFANVTSHLPLHTIVYDNQSFSAPIIEQMGLHQYHFTNLGEKAKVVKTFNHIAYFVLYLSLCVLTLYIWINLCKKFISDIKENLKQNYFKESLLSIPIKYALLTVVGLGIPALLIFIFIKSDFSIYIISKYIPYDNLFDIKHYISCIIDNSHYMNRLSLIGDTYLPNLYENTLSFVVWLTIFFVVLCNLLLINILSFVKQIKDELRSCR